MKKDAVYQKEMRLKFCFELLKTKFAHLFQFLTKQKFVYTFRILNFSVITALSYINKHLFFHNWIALV